jgi:predicted ATP-grasp superfamily ATP-dependent carboligase
MSVLRRRIDSTLPPALIIDGGANVLSVARSLGRRGVRVLVLGSARTDTRFSRFCEWIPLSGKGSMHTQWLSWFVGEEGKAFRGGVIIPCGDNGLEFVVRHRAELEQHFRVYEANDEVLAAMLDKAATHSLAKKAGVPSPEIWIVNTRKELLEVKDKIRFPCGLKPRVSHEFKKHFDKKLFVIHDADELLRIFGMVEPFKLEMMITELIPGGDNGYCSYYSYLDEEGKPLFHFTKRKLRQHPTGFGIGTYHLTDWNKDVADLGLKFFQGIGLRGLACVEFKVDPRDGQLKLIECNHRFTEANELVMLSGLDLASLVYNRLVGLPLPKLDSYTRGMCLIKPWQDVLAFRQLHSRGELTWRTWIAQLARPMSFLYFKWWDPMPTLYQWSLFVRKQIRRMSGSLTKESNPQTVSPASIMKAS